MLLVSAFKHIYSGVQSLPKYGRYAVPCAIQCRGATCGSPAPDKGAGAGGYKIRFKKYTAPTVVEHDLKNMLLKRPMSPHLDIYGPTLTAMTSIAQRATGCIVTFYALMMAGGAMFLPNGIETYVTLIQSLNLGWFSCFFIKALVGAPFAYHYCNGIRFVLWNLGRYLELEQVYSTAKVSFIATAAITVLFCLL